MFGERQLEGLVYNTPRDHFEVRHEWCVLTSSEEPAKGGGGWPLGQL